MSLYQSDDEDPRGVRDPHLLALGLGGTNMMAMLWTVALGRRAVGVEMRGDPHLGVHWNIRADLYHQFGLIDRMMVERYGEEGIPLRGGNRPFRLAETLYSIETEAGDIVVDEIIDGFDTERHVAGTIHHVEFIDDRWRDGVPSRVVTLLHPPEPPAMPDPARIRANMVEVLDGPSTFQGEAAGVLIMLRRYLERLEQMDLESGREVPRVRLFTQHRVVREAPEVPEGEQGIVHLPDGRKGFRIEALQELDYRGKLVRVRRPGSSVIDLGVAELVVIAEGFHSTDAERLGFEQEDVAVDHGDGRGPVVAQADFLAGLMEVLVGGRLRRRIASEFDADGREYWARQIAVGHENDPEIGWILVQVPDFKVFDPIEEGLVPEGTDVNSPEFFAAYEKLVYDFYIEQVADILELPASTLKRVTMIYGPKIFSLVERAGQDALIAPNVVVAGDSFGNGHFLTSGGAMTGMVGHSRRVLEYWQARDQGVPHEEAIRTTADRIKEDTHAWLHVSMKEYSEAVPINFGAERIKQIEAKSGIGSGARAQSIDAARRLRHSLIPLSPSDWRRFFVRPGRTFSGALPELHAMHPALRRQKVNRKGSKTQVVFATTTLGPATARLIDAVLGQPGVQMGLLSSEPPDGLPERIKDRLFAHALLPAAPSAQDVVQAVEGMVGALGRPEILLTPMEDLEVAVAEAREALGLRGTSAECARTFRDKAASKTLLREAGIPVPRFSLVTSPEEALRFADEIGYPVVLKPRDGTGGDSLSRASNAAELEERLRALPPSPERPLLCEEYVHGAECSLDVIAIDGVPAWFSAARWSPSILGAMEDPAVQWSIVLPRETDDPAPALVRRMGFAALRALGMDSGIATIEWFRRPDGSAVISEVATRPPGSQIMRLMGLAHGADLYRAWANATVNGLFAPIPRVNAAGAVWLRGQGEGSSVAAVHGVEEVRRELGDVIAEAAFPEAGAPYSTAFKGHGYVLVRHPQTEVVEQAVRRVASTVRVELA